MRFQCPFCQGIVSVPNSDMGADVQCGHCGEIVSVPTDRVATGAVISDFIIQEELGRGGMGVVYLAHQITLDRPSALKILAGAYANNPEFVVDFIKEARSAAKLNHPHVVQAYAVGEDEGVYYFAMEHIDGETMKDFMKREGGVKIDFALEVVQQIAEALDYAWKEQRLVHRDIKPDNIMLTVKGRAKLADLGLARVAGDIDDADSEEVMGTPQYISPEHLTGAEMDVRSDIYSLGATLFHLLTNRFAFEGRTATDIARKHLEELLTPPREINPNIPESVSRIVLKMMAKNPNDRYQSAEDLVEDLRLVRQGKKPISAGLAGEIIKPSKPGKPGKQFSIKKAAGASTGSFKSLTSTTLSTSTGSIKKSMRATGTNSKVDKHQLKLEKERKAKGQLILVLVLLACFVLAGAAFIVWNMTRNNSPENDSTLDAQGNKIIEKKVVGGQSPQASSGGFLADLNNILKFAKKNPGREQDILQQCDDFLKEYPKIKSKSQEEKRIELMAVYVPLDEARIKSVRETIRQADVIILKARKEQMQLENEAKAKDTKKEENQKRESERQKNLKELEARNLKVAEVKKKKNKVRIDEYIVGQEKDKNRMRYLSLFYSVENKYKDAKKEFDSAVNEKSKATSLYKLEAEKVSLWGEKMSNHVEIASKFWDTLSNSEEKLKGMQLEILPGTLANIQTIKNGMITARTPGQEIIKKSIKSLPYKQLKRILLKTVPLTSLKNPLFHYLFCDAQFLSAKEFMPVKEWDSEWDASVLIYAKKRLQSIRSIIDVKERNRATQVLIRSVGRAACQKAKNALDEQE